MKDAEADILKAFIAALTQQEKPLPADVQNELNSLGKTFNTDKIESIAEKHAPLLSSYEAAHKWLVQHSSTRNKGNEFLPDASSEKDNTSNKEIDNASSDIHDLKSLPEILAKIEERLDHKNLAKLGSEIFNTSDPVQSAKDAMFALIQIA